MPICGGALQLFELQPADTNDDERQMLVQRRDGIAGLLGDGLLSATAARTERERLAEQIAHLEPARAPLTAARELTREPERVWAEMTQVQRRQVLRVLFASVSLQHVGLRHGPQVDVRRIQVAWR